MPRRKLSREFPNQRTSLTLSWEGPSRNGASLVFDKAAWALFESCAERRGIETEEMISVAVAQLLGRIINYRRRA